jgi:hypothetical protein
VSTPDFERIDDVSVMNGSLGLSIPLGQTYPAGGVLSYQLVAQQRDRTEDAQQLLPSAM